MLFLPDVIKFGPFMVPSGPFVFVLAGMIALMILKWIIYSKDQSTVNRWMDILFEGVFFYFLTWKLSAVFFQLTYIIRNPLLLLYANGGTWGMFLGILVSVWFMYRKMKKHSFSWLLFLDLTALYLSITFGLYWLVIPVMGKATDLPWGIALAENAVFHPIHWYRVIVLFLAGLAVYWLKKSPGNGSLFSFLAIFIGSGFLLVSYFESPLKLTLGLTFYQWIFVLLTLLGGLLLNFTEKNAERKNAPDRRKA
ncbi:prolipoprotein diacylglyceryl transferase [Bacillaceae bacterium]